MHGLAVPPHTRPRILVVEDEFIVAFDLCETVEATGYEVDGPHGSLSDGIAAVTDQMPDCAILDVRLGKDEVYPLADILSAAGIPIVFHSGHADGKRLHDRYPGSVACAKPCPPTTLIAQLQGSVANAA